MQRTLCAVVLAAGQGSRYRHVAGEHRNKLLAQCRGLDGVDRSVLEQVLTTLCASVDKCVVITRPDYSEVAELSLQYGCEVVILESPGMGDSIAEAVAAQPDHGGWLIALGDMPFIDPQTIVRLIQSIDDESITVPVHQAQYGHPVAFGRSFGVQLMALAGEKGARRLFQSARINEVRVDDPGVLWDIDVPTALDFKPGIGR